MIFTQLTVSSQGHQSLPELQPLGQWERDEPGDGTRQSSTGCNSSSAAQQMQECVLTC